MGPYLLIQILTSYKVGCRKVRWIENWLSCQAQRVVTGGTKFSWRTVTGGVSPEYDSGANTV